MLARRTPLLTTTQTQPGATTQETPLPAELSPGLLRDEPITCLPSKLDSVLFLRQPHLSGHNQAGWLVGDLEHHTTIASTQLADLLKVIILQFPHLLLLGQKGLKALPLLLIELQLLQLLLQSLQVGPVPKGGRTGQ